jgi:DNA-binding beta-propeller fold protein YncE
LSSISAIAESSASRPLSWEGVEELGLQAFGETGSGRGRFSQPMDIALDEAGRIYVADMGNRRIVRIDELDGSGWTEYPAP